MPRLDKIGLFQKKIQIEGVEHLATFLKTPQEFFIFLL